MQYERGETLANHKVVVIDGRGGGMGKSIVERLRAILPQANIIAVGTNPFAMQVMQKAGATSSYTGEENVIKFAEEADLIIGVMGILIPNGLKGELTPKMVLAITASEAVKVLVPMNRCGIKVAVEEKTLSVHIDEAVELAKQELSKL